MPTGGSVTWTTATTGCTITGSNPQLLSCSLGDMAANTAKTIVVSAVTSLGHCAQMDNAAANASATNASQVSNDGHIACQTPVLQIAKTPDVQGDAGGLITAGDTAT